MCKARNKNGMIFWSFSVLTLYEVYRRSEAKENCDPSLPKALISSLSLNNEQRFLLFSILPKLMLSAKMWYYGMGYFPKYLSTKLQLIFFGKRIILIYRRHWGWGRGRHEGSKVLIQGHGNEGSQLLPVSKASFPDEIHEHKIERYYPKLHKEKMKQESHLRLENHLVFK